MENIEENEIPDESPIKRREEKLPKLEKKNSKILGESDEGDGDSDVQFPFTDEYDYDTASPNIPHQIPKKPPLIKTKPSPLTSPSKRDENVIKNITIKSPKNPDDNPLKLQKVKPVASYTPPKPILNEITVESEEKKLAEIEILKKIEAGINAKIKREVSKLKKERKKVLENLET